MRLVFSQMQTSSKTLSYALGALTLGLAVAVFATSMAPGDIAAWALKVFGSSFLTLFSGLSLLVVYCWVRINNYAMDPGKRAFWVEVGLHGANGVSTLALTYTLLGISLGIGTLADQELNPDTVQGIIGELTHYFSLAFLTTVVGLPSAAVLRALISISDMRINEREGQRR